MFKLVLKCERLKDLAALAELAEERDVQVVDIGRDDEAPVKPKRKVVRRYTNGKPHGLLVMEDIITKFPIGTAFHRSCGEVQKIFLNRGMKPSGAGSIFTALSRQKKIEQANFPGEWKVVNNDASDLKMPEVSR